MQLSLIALVEGTEASVSVETVVLIRNQPRRGFGLKTNILNRRLAFDRGHRRKPL